jgi:hypothetical protein
MTIVSNNPNPQRTPDRAKLELVPTCKNCSNKAPEPTLTVGIHHGMNPDELYRVHDYAYGNLYSDNAL